jgi:hypothetical protein
MAEMADSSEDHRNAQTVSGGYDVCVLDGAAGLDDGGCSGVDYGFKAVRKREKGV